MINTLGKFLIILGLFLIILGLGVIVFSKFRIPFLGRLPGDILIKKDNFIFYFPLATSILVSIVLSLILYFISRK